MAFTLNCTRLSVFFVFAAMMPLLASALHADDIFPPTLPGRDSVATDTEERFLKRPAGLSRDVDVATTAPTIDFLYFPVQTYVGKPWSCWGDALFADGKYYTSIGDHLAPEGNAFVYEYDPATKKLRLLADVRKALNRPKGHYTPGKIHGRLDWGSDGWLYFCTHRGSTKVTTPEFHFRGEPILRCHPESGEVEIVEETPVPDHCIPASALDPDRMIMYGGTIGGSSKDIKFFAYDVKHRRLLYSGDNGPYRSMILARSTGKLYYVPNEAEGPLMRFDPEKPGEPKPAGKRIGLRAATQETADGFVYTVSSGQGKQDADLYEFNTRTEEVRNLGPAAVGTQAYITTVTVDPSGRYLYYIPGAHGGSEQDGTPVVQFDIKTRRKKVLAFLHPFYKDRYDTTLVGTFGTALSAEGDQLFITWNTAYKSDDWNACAMTVVHIPESERAP